MINVFYFYYYLFYKNIFKDDEPYFTARLALTASEALLLISVIDIASAYFFCVPLSKYYMIAITLVLLAMNTFIFFNRAKAARVIKSSPKLFNNNKVSIILTWVFFLTSLSIMFWLGDVVRMIIENCNK